jgi:hypothetical protein
MKRTSRHRARSRSLYKGLFNYHGEVHVMWRKAVNKEHAFSLFTSALARSLHLTASYRIRNYFMGGDGFWEVVLASTLCSKIERKEHRDD